AGAFEYRPGPLSANVVLVDEINRATPRAQSALLEAMQERQLTVDEATHTLPDPFLVIATQNPVELEGTFPLPEAQLDRFLFLLNLGYPDADDEDTILRIHGPANVRAETLRPILNPAEIAELRDEVHGVRVGDAVRRYAVETVRATRPIDGVDLGASPRAALALYRAAQAHAAIRGRAYVLPDDVKAQAVAVLRHRLFLNADAQMRGRTTTVIIAEVLARTPVPAEDVAATAGCTDGASPARPAAAPLPRRRGRTSQAGGRESTWLDRFWVSNARAGTRPRAPARPRPGPRRLCDRAPAPACRRLARLHPERTDRSARSRGHGLPCAA